MAYIEVRTSTPNSITVYLNELSMSFGLGERKAYWYIGFAGGNIPTENNYSQTYFERIQIQQPNGKDITFTDLEPDTKYGIYCVVYYDSKVLDDFEGVFKTDAEGGGGGDDDETTIERWKWSASNGSASAELTHKALKAVSFGGATTDFSYLVWNDMVDKVHDIIMATTKWWYSDYASYANTKMTHSNEELTAKMFNSLRNNLESVGYGYLGLAKIPDGYDVGEIPHPVYSGKDTTVSLKLRTVYGHYFTTLADYINSCINML